MRTGSVRYLWPRHQTFHQRRSPCARWFMAASTNPDTHALTRRGAITLAAVATTTALAAPARCRRTGETDRQPPRHGARCPTASAPRASRPGPVRPSTSARSPTAGSSPATCSPSAPASCCPAATGRSLRGLYLDRRTGLVWAVGGLGAERARLGRGRVHRRRRGRHHRARRGLPQRPRGHRARRLGHRLPGRPAHANRPGPSRPPARHPADLRAPHRRVAGLRRRHRRQRHP